MQVQFPMGTAHATLDVDAVIVDLDGTMVDTIGDFAEAIRGMLADLPLSAKLMEHRHSIALQCASLQNKEVADMVGKGTEHLLRSVLQRLLGKLVATLPAEVPLPTVDMLYPQALHCYQHHYLGINGQYAAVYPGVHAGLQMLKDAGLRLACVTNKPLDFALPLLRAKDLASMFDKVYGGDSFARKKPDPLPLIQTCQALASTPARTLMLGDSSNDAQAARAAGCPVVLVTYGYNHGRPIHEVDADGYVNALTELSVPKTFVSLSG